MATHHRHSCRSAAADQQPATRWPVEAAAPSAPPAGSWPAAYRPRRATARSHHPPHADGRPRLSVRCRCGSGRPRNACSRHGWRRRVPSIMPAWEKRGRGGCWSSSPRLSACPDLAQERPSGPRRSRQPGGARLHRGGAAGLCQRLPACLPGWIEEHLDAPVCQTAGHPCLPSGAAGGRRESQAGALQGRSSSWIRWRARATRPAWSGGPIGWCGGG